MYTRTETFCISKNATTQEAIAKMNEGRLGIVLVVDEDRRLIGTITDGDIRRAVLAKFPLSHLVTALLEQKTGTEYAKPLYALAGQTKSEYLKILRQNALSHLPIINGEKQVVALLTSDEFMVDSLASIDAVVMAGGRGIRLMPLTGDIPKPMLPVGEKPLLEIIIHKLRTAGIQKINVTTHHKPEKIKEYFGDGRDFGIDLNYVSEERPLGTAGALGLLENIQKTTLVINGDILTDVDFKAMFQFHREHNADLTVAVRVCELEVPFGVVECQGAQVKAIQEKPKVSLMVNAGIYLLEPHVYSYIPAGEQYHMTDLIQHLISKKINVISFPIHEYWIDIGAHAEYEKAQKEIERFNF
ncbi:MAG: nucleotidyltransferase family protein [Deltaproteobacteria bacterium]|nr:nucleotidyltransferase family protein [Deltaproteobacteria bacterium]